MDRDVTVVVTSCRRLDLLERTLVSFLAGCDTPLREVIVIEDSDDAGVFAVCDRVGARFPDAPIRVILNGVNLGQTRSVDKAYAEVTTPYILHLEDDWEFMRPGLLRDALAVLDSEPEALLVLLRDAADMPNYVRSLTTHEVAGVRYKRIFPEISYRWHTFSFNPTLKRTADYRALPGGYAALGDELAISVHYKTEGWLMAWLLGRGAVHMDSGTSNFQHKGRTRAERFSRLLSRMASGEQWEIWRQSLRRRFWHTLRCLGVDTEPLQSRRRRRPPRRDG